MTILFSRGFHLNLALAAAAVLMLFAAGGMAAPSISSDAPPADRILSTLKKSHPRLLMDQKGFAQLRAEISANPTLKAHFEVLVKTANKILTSAPSKYEIPDGLRLLATSRKVRDRVQTLGLVYRMTGDRRYADRLWKELEVAMAFPDWNPRHFLDTAEMTGAFAVGYDWLYEVWTPEQRKSLRDAMVGKGLNPAMTVYHKGGWWPVAHHNWNQVCNGGIGVGALAIGDEEPAICGEILHNAVQSIPLAMREFGPDGAWGEGPGYWGYATDYNVLFLAALDSALGTDFGLSKIPGFAATGAFPMYFTGPFGKTFNYADVGGEGKFGGAFQLFWLATKFGGPSFAAFQQAYVNTKVSALDLVWGAAWEARHPAMGSYPLNRYFRGSEVVTMRSAWNDPNALYLGFKAGDNKVNHGHLDLGSWIFDALGCRWATDLGSDNYNMPGYFGKARWTYYRLRAEAHNTLLINPGAGPDQDPKAVCRITRFQEKPAMAVTDLTAAYQAQATRVERGIRLLDGAVLVQDEIATPRPAEVWWLMHTPATVEIQAGGAAAILKHEGKQVRVSLISEPTAKFEVLPSAPMASSPHPEKQGENKGISTLALHYSGVRELRIVVRVDTGSAHDGSGERPVALSQWK